MEREIEDCTDEQFDEIIKTLCQKAAGGDKDAAMGLRLILANSCGQAILNTVEA